MEKFSLRCYFLSSGRSRALPGLLTGSKPSTETNSQKFYQSFSPLDRGDLAQADWSKKSIQIALEGLKFNLKYHAAILGKAQNSIFYIIFMINFMVHFLKFY